MSILIKILDIIYKKPITMDRGQLLVDYSQYQTHYQEVSKHIIH